METSLIKGRIILIFQRLKTWEPKETPPLSYSNGHNIIIG